MIAREVAKLYINEILPRQRKGLPVPEPAALRWLAEMKVAGVLTHAEVRRVIKEGQS